MVLISLLIENTAYFRHLCPLCSDYSPPNIPAVMVNSDCKNYPAVSNDTTDQAFLIEEFNTSAGTTWERVVDSDKIIFVTHGKILLSYRELVRYTVGPAQMFVMPRDAYYKVTTVDDTRFVVFCLSVGTHISDLFPMLEDNYLSKTVGCGFCTLPIYETLAYFLDTIIACLAGGVEVVNYYEFKFRELLVLMKRYYAKEDLTMLFCPVIKQDAGFTDFVLNNFDKVKTVKELADMSHYSLSAFNKHFKYVFGTPPYVWMKHQKSMKLFNTIKNSDDTLQQICDDFGFSSLSQLTNFCKANFGQTPTQIRKDRNMESIDAGNDPENTEKR